jgi:hypothetical protein
MEKSRDVLAVAKSFWSFLPLPVQVRLFWRAFASSVEIFQAEDEVSTEICEAVFNDVSRVNRNR